MCRATWFQCQEKQHRSVHFEWLHDTWSQLLTRVRARRLADAFELNFVEFEHGFQYQRIRQGQAEEDDLWTIGRVCLGPTGSGSASTSSGACLSMTSAC